VADLIVQTEGSSKYFKGGIVAYQNEAKRKLLGVEFTLLLSKGAVDSEVAFEMAKGAIYSFDSDCAISTTGFADGDQAGLVYICALTPTKRVVREFRLCDDAMLSRQEVRKVAAEQALKLLLTLL
jgi:PncC family amidohydrolase